MIEIMNGDCRKLVQKIPDKSIDCVMTSPPYWALRDYGHDDQMGMESTPEEYIENMVSFFNDVKNKLKNSGNCFVNIGDTYASSKVKSIPTKSLCMIPQRFAWNMIENGWILRSQIIWHKPNGMPESVKDRMAKRYETVFHFVKSPNYYFDLDSIREEHSEESIKRAMRGNSSKNKYAKDSHLPNGVHANTMSKARDFKGYDGMYEKVKNGETPLHPKGKNPGDVWSINNKSYKGAHFATYPIELVERTILSGCPINGIVLDPFGGSGTTGEFCKNNNRYCILMELNGDYTSLIEERCL